MIEGLVPFIRQVNERLRSETDDALSCAQTSGNPVERLQRRVGDQQPTQDAARQERQARAFTVQSNLVDKTLQRRDRLQIGFGSAESERCHVGILSASRCGQYRAPRWACFPGCHLSGWLRGGANRCGYSPFRPDHVLRAPTSARD